jgi:adenosylhomocysteine nucleosidase
VKTLVLTPLPFELDALILHLKEKGHQASETLIGSLKVYEFSKLGWFVSLGGHGKAQFAVQTQFLIDRCGPFDLVICAGGAGRLAPQVAVLDVVVGEKSVEHDFRLKFIKRPSPEFPGDSAFIEKLRLFKPDGYRIHFGPIASGDEDITDPVRADELRLQTGGLAVAWEGSGGARACRFNRTRFIEVRGVADASNATTNNDFVQNLKRAMTKLTEVLLAVI